MTILEICNRTENWKTAFYLSPLFDGRSVGLVERLGEESRLHPDDVKLELFWKGMRDLLHQRGVKRRSMQQTFAEDYARLFSDLRVNIQEFGEFRELLTDNYATSTDQQKAKLTNNLANTEIDIVLESPNYLFIGEAKDEMSFGADGDLVLVHQLIRQYVMARILVEHLPDRSKKEVIPFVVGKKIDSIQKTSQIKFMISQGWLKERNILKWDQIKQSTR